MDPIYIATLTSRNYDWVGVGTTREEAIRVLKVRFFEHVTQSLGLTQAQWYAEFLTNSEASSWEELYDPNVRAVRPGEGYMDDEDTEDISLRGEENQTPRQMGWVGDNGQP